MHQILHHIFVYTVFSSCDPGKMTWLRIVPYYLSCQKCSHLSIFQWMLFIHYFCFLGPVFFWDKIIEILVSEITVFYSPRDTNTCNMEYSRLWFDWMCVAGVRGGVSTSLQSLLVLISAEIVLISQQWFGYCWAHKCTWLWTGPLSRQ